MCSVYTTSLDLADQVEREIDGANLRERVRGEIESYLDKVLWYRSIEIEAAEVGSMTDFYRAWRDRLNERRP